MTISTTSLGLTSDGMKVYMLRWGDYEEKAVYGPYVGQLGIDFGHLADEYRRERYAERESLREDYCRLSESDFVAWLVSRRILLTVETTDVYVALSTSFDDAYVPKHWPQCPECNDGRGEPQYGSVRRSLNRVMTFRRCTECRHEWGHDEVANDTSRPMLDDDGRDTLGACVPFAISKACGLNFADVLKVCRAYGWSEASGMWPTDAQAAANEMGYELVLLEQYTRGATSPLTLKKLVAALPRGRNYIVGVKNHWLALVGGEVVDNVTASSPVRRVMEVYEVRTKKASAA